MATAGTIVELIDRINAPLIQNGSSHANGLSVPWSTIVAAGLPSALLDEAEGGYGIDPEESLSAARRLAFHGLSTPLAETMMCNWLLAKAGLPVTEGPAAAVPFTECRRCESVSYGRDLCTLVLVTDDRRLAPIDGSRRVGHGLNLAGEPRDIITFDEGALSWHRSPISASTLNAIGAMLGALKIAGAGEAILDLSVRHASTRRQFGRALREFQAVQQHLAVLAEQVAAAIAAADMAAAAFKHAIDRPDDFTALAAAAKIRAGEAGSIICSLSHQLHGAIGFTQEYTLQRFTRRIWAWREEDGSETFWATRLGDHLLEGTTAPLWVEVTRLAEASQ